jgi:sulfur carrier protein ThiS adenylyltransferase
VNRFEEGLARYLPAGFTAFLRSVKIGVIGAGGLGSNCTMHLARSGFSDLVLADPDTVEPSNLNRQHFTLAQVGQAKVLALRENILAVNPAARMETHVLTVDAGNIREFFGSCQAVVEAVDDPRSKKRIVESLVPLGCLVVSASGIGGSGLAGRMLVRWPLTNLALVGDQTTPCDSATPPLSPGVGMAAAMQADIVLHHFLTLFQERTP